MSLREVKKVVENFIADDRSDLLVLKGEWGVGKTYSWNDIVRTASAARSIGHRHYSYVSLFGLNNLEDVRTEISASRVSSESIKDSLTAREWAKDAKKILKDIERLPILKDKTSGALGTVMFRFIKDTLICLDDLERRGSGLGIKDILGLASLLKEQRGCKIVFILNESVLLPAEKEEFRRHSEKVIDAEIEFSPEPEEVFNLIFSRDNPHYDYIKDCCIKLDIRNIRILQRIRRYLDTVSSSSLRDAEAGTANKVIKSLVLFVWCHYQKDKGAPSLSFVKKYRNFERSLIGSRTEPTEDEKEWSRRLDNYGYVQSDDLDKELVKLVEVGSYDAAALAEQLRKKNEEVRDSEGKESYYEVCRIYGRSFDNNEQEFLEKLVGAFRANMKYLRLGNLQSTVQMARAFNQNELADKLIDEFFEFHKDSPYLKFLDAESSGAKIEDEYLVNRLQEVSSTFKDQRTLAEVVKKITESRSWSPDDIALLASSGVDDYYGFFKSADSDRLAAYVDRCLEFKNDGIDDGQTMSIGSKAKEALIRISKESAINKMRVLTIYKIDVDAEPEAK